MTLAINNVDGHRPSNTAHRTQLAKETKVDAILVTERRHINYPAVPTRWRASVIKVSRQMCSVAFERTLTFSYTVIILA